MTETYNLFQEKIIKASGVPEYHQMNGRECVFFAGWSSACDQNLNIYKFQDDGSYCADSLGSSGPNESLRGLPLFGYFPAESSYNDILMKLADRYDQVRSLVLSGKSDEIYQLCKTWQ